MTPEKRQDDGREAPTAPRPLWVLVALSIAATFTVAVLLSLGIWQVQRLAWKEALIERVDARVHADPVRAPGPGQWSEITEESAGYRRVELEGVFLTDKETLVQAVTIFGPGYWVMTPLATHGKWVVYVNRGFVPKDRSAPDQRVEPEGRQKVVGLLRMDEPGGAFLRSNQPEADRWYSRDVNAMADADDVPGLVAPYFIDAQTGPGAELAETYSGPGNEEMAPVVLQSAGPDQLPVPGLTVIHFRNSHLSYAITWFTLAFGLAAASIYFGARDIRSRRKGTRSRD